MSERRATPGSPERPSLGVVASLRVDLIDDVVLVKGMRSDSLSTDRERYRRELLAVVRDRLSARRSDEPAAEAN